MTAIAPPHPPSRLSHGDRFISARESSTELSNNFDAKSEIFSLSYQISQYDKLGAYP